MINSENLCMSCMKEIGSVTQCPYCGYHVDTPQLPPYLPVRTLLANRFLIGKLLDYNGDGATYMGWDITTKAAVTVREFVPDAICERKQGKTEISVMAGCDIAFNDCLSGFLELWRKLARLRGLSALVSVIDVFEENSTAYAVCEYVESITLREYLLRIPTGYISWDRARALFMPVLSTLGMLHTAGIIHRGISPMTLYLGRDGKMRISGFSIWQARTARGDLTAQLFPGYAAIEQYGFEGQQGAWTDIYAFAATLYRALIGSDPIEATSRLTNDRLMVPGKFAEQLPAYVINGLVNALQILPEDRTRTVEQLRAELSASPTAAAAGTDFNPEPVATAREPAPGKKPPEKNKKKNTGGKKLDENKMIILKTGLVSAIVCLVIFLLVVIFAGDKLGIDSKDEPDSSAIITESGFVTVPKFVGRSYDEFKNDAYWSKKFTLTVIEDFSDTVAKGFVIAQSVPENTQLNIGSEVKLTVSKGIETFVLPNVVNLTYEQAEEKLEQYNFKVSKTIKENDGSKTENVVFSVTQTVGIAYPKGTQVELFVWGPAPTTVPPVTEPPTTTSPPQAVTQAPTHEPTKAPTQAPTQPPTKAPTQPPTQAPTQAPTKAPEADAD